jgi:hypothetical protein
VDEAEDRRLMAIAPHISRTSVALLRRVAGLEPAERVPEEALRTADEVLDRYGSDGLRVLVMSLTGWAALGVERDAQLTGRSLESVLDILDLTALESHPEL